MSIVIIGSSYAAIAAIETLVKEIGNSADKSKFQITVISKSDKIYFNPSAPRLLVEPESATKAFFSAEENFKKRAKDVKYQFIHGSVERADFDAKSIQVTTAGGSSQEVSYDTLIIASGSHSGHAALKLDGGAQDSLDSIKEVAKSIKDAQSIAVLGGGATGVEIAGEIAFTYPKKQVTIFTGSSGPLYQINKAAPTTKKLEALGVKVVNKKRYTSIEPSKNGGNSIIFNDGTTEDFDYFVPAYGVFPNSSFVDAKYLNKEGFVIVDEYLRVKGHPEVLAIGDVASITEKTIVDLKFRQSKPLLHTLKKQLFDKNTQLVAYAGGKPTIFVPVSKNGGIGLAFGLSIPSFFVKNIKSKDFFLGQAAKDYS